jgi:hypothetical protein
MFLTVTVAFGTAAPVASVTVPCMAAVDWAKAVPEKINEITSTHASTNRLVNRSDAVFIQLLLIFGKDLLSVAAARAVGANAFGAQSAGIRTYNSAVKFMTPYS